MNLGFNYTLLLVAVGTGALGVLSGALGSFAMLRKQSLLGDAISHAALPGIVLAFLLTRSKSSLVLVLGAAAAGWLGALLVMSIVKTTRVKEDSALGLVLSVFFGAGLVLLTYTQRYVADASQAGLDKFLLGQAATLLLSDVLTIAVLGGLALAVLALLWKELKLLSFDPDFAASLGYPTRRLDVLLTSLVVLAIVVGLQTVGVVLMSAMIVAPAAAARQWTDRLGVMVCLASFFGALAGVSGTLLSDLLSRPGKSVATGPTIVLCLSALVGLSLLLAPNRGLVWRWLREQRNRRQLRLEAVLADLYELARQHEDPGHGHAPAVLRAMSDGRGVDASLRELERRGWAHRAGPDAWALTPAGRAEVERCSANRSRSN
jgi:manganese/zinc/iron transport system permease protein